MLAVKVLYREVQLKNQETNNEKQSIIYRKELREEYGLSQKDIANYLNIKQNTYSQYELGILNYPIDALIKLAKLYNVSLDYMVGLTDEKTPYPRA